MNIKSHNKSIIAHSVEKTHKLGRYYQKVPETNANILSKLVSHFPELQATLLESQFSQSKEAQWSLLGLLPDIQLFHQKGKWKSQLNNQIETLESDPFEILQGPNDFKPNPALEGIPFLGGFMGYFSYEYFFEPIQTKQQKGSNFSKARFVFYSASLAYHHKTKELFIIASHEKDLEILQQKLHESKNTKEEPKVFHISQVKEALQKEKYLNKITSIKESIAKGDIYQANFTHPLNCKIKGLAFSIYQKLMQKNPAPFSAYLNDGKNRFILSSSPERLFKINNNKIISSPIKGTINRKENPKQDLIQKEKLLNSEKDHAELAMIVDLVRNDLGKICQYGSVKVLHKHELQSFQKVHHLVATIEGELKPGINIKEVFQALFPGGSITGTPKIRAIQIISELEDQERGPYTGSIGYIDPRGKSDFNIAIRTLLIDKEDLSFQVGGGIVWDSIAEAEYEETQHKASAMIDALKEGKSLKT